MIHELIFFIFSELAAELFTEVKNGHTLEKLDVEEASRISRNACVSPCSLVLALLYIERLKNCNPEYLHQVAPSELFLVSLVIDCGISIIVIFLTSVKWIFINDY